MKTNPLVATAAGIAVAAMMSVSAFAAERASGADIEAALKGKTLQGGTLKSTFSEYYAPDGTIKGKGYTGKWRVENNTGCMDYGKGWKCWSAFIDAPSSIWYLNGKVDAVGISVDGNPNNY